MNHSDRFSLTELAFDRLLERLDPNRERAGEKYELLRTRLLKFFEWRGSYWPEEQADECIDRAIRRLSRGQDIEDLEAFARGVARMVLLEDRRRKGHERRRLEAVRWMSPPVEEPRGSEACDRCLEACLGRLAPSERELIIDYYRGEGGDRIQSRQALAARLGLPLGVLRVRAHRIRVRIEMCVRQCLEIPTLATGAPRSKSPSTRKG